jgi:uncharacterized protein YecE (DUF72 family)
MPAVEINSSFYRPHLPATYRRWRESVPADFRFSVKLPRSITHLRRLRETDHDIANFVTGVAELGEKLGCILVQLPPSLRFEQPVAEAFFDALCGAAPVPITLEARHPSWFADDAGRMLAHRNIATVFADPPVGPTPLADFKNRLIYVRLHGSPTMYHSTYSNDFLTSLLADLARHRAAGRTVWTIFDNTASGAALPNALFLLARSQSGMECSPSAGPVAC